MDIVCYLRIILKITGLGKNPYTYFQKKPLTNTDNYVLKAGTHLYQQLSGRIQTHRKLSQQLLWNTKQFQTLL